MVKTGNYWLMAWDVGGRRDKRYDDEADSFTVADTLGDDLMAAGLIGSYVVVRVIKNSGDSARQRWEGIRR